MTAPARVGLAARLAATPLGVRLAAVSALVTALVVGVTVIALNMRVGAEVRRVFALELATSQRGVQRLQDRELRLLLATSALVSTSPTLRAALQTWRVESNTGLPPRNDLVATIQHEVEGTFADLGRDLLVVTDDRGRVLAAVGRGATPRPGDDLWRLPAVRHALIADTVTADSGFGVLRVGGVPLQVGCVAILLEGYPIGALVLGERLDSVLPRLDVARGTHAVVAAGDVVLASTLEGVAAGARWEPPSGTGAAARLRRGSEEFLAVTLPLGATESGAPATLYLLRSETAALRPIMRSLGGTFLLAGIVAVLLVAAGTVVVSRTTVRPLSRFVAFMQSGAERRALAPFGEAATGPAEIRTLTDAYNQLVDSLRRSEEALRQSQKLEALGTLAGGVAHDFNNLLSVILGYAQIAAVDRAPGSREADDLAQITQAAERASGLVKQLLAFSRKQVLQPQILDLNRVVAGMQQMLQRLIREDVQLETHLEPQLARIQADPGQLEQVIMNLVVNARDAMPQGGRITISTSNVVLDQQYESLPEAIRGGPAVMLAVADTGVGMDEETRRRIFEPFFTTKEPGKGTGLGLATVYGIVRQSEGSITVYSEPGKGCTFRCYFPRAAEVRAVAAGAPVVEAAPGGTETVLLVEDEAQLRALMRRSLRSLGYEVLEASHGLEALEVSGEHRSPIHLLVTDVVMPHLSGRELAERLTAARPDLRVLFLSGHTEEAIARHGVLAPGTVFLQKPVTPDALARQVREILDGEPAARSGA